MPDYSNRDTVYIDLAAPGDGDLLDHPDQSRRGPDRLRRRAVLRLRPVRVPRRDRHVVRGAAGLRRGGAAARPGSDAFARNRSRGCSSAAPTTTTPRPAARMCPAGRDPFTGWGTLDVERGAHPPDRRARCRPPTTTSRTTTPAPGRTRCRRCRGRSRRRSTTGTTTSTSTASTCTGDSGCSRAPHPETAGVVRMGVWAPGTQQVDGLGAQQLLVAQSRLVGVQARVGYRATQTGTYYLEAQARPADARAARLPAGGRARLTLAAVLAQLRAGRRPAGPGPGCRRRACAAGRPSSPRRRRRRTPPRRSRRPGQRMAPPPTRAPRRIVGPRISSWRRSVRPMKLSFVVTTHGAMKTSSSSVE